MCEEEEGKRKKGRKELIVVSVSQSVSPISDLYAYLDGGGVTSPSSFSAAPAADPRSLHLHSV